MSEVDEHRKEALAMSLDSFKKYTLNSMLEILGVAILKALLYVFQERFICFSKASCSTRLLMHVYRSFEDFRQTFECHEEVPGSREAVTEARAHGRSSFACASAPRDRRL